jgi:hypothetical protein
LDDVEFQTCRIATYALVEGKTNVERDSLGESWLNHSKAGVGTFVRQDLVEVSWDNLFTSPDITSPVAMYRRDVVFHQYLSAWLFHVFATFGK